MLTFLRCSDKSWIELSWYLWAIISISLPLASFMRPVWGAGSCTNIVQFLSDISIHAPRVGRNCYRICDNWSQCISIYAPLMGAQSRNGFAYIIGTPFQSMRPIGRKPEPSNSLKKNAMYFNIFAPHGAQRSIPLTCIWPVDFNLRAPCGAQLRSHRNDRESFYFNLRAPCGAQLSGRLKALS